MGVKDRLTTLRIRKKSLVRFRLIASRLEVLKKKQLNQEDVLDELLAIADENLNGVEG